MMKQFERLQSIALRNRWYFGSGLQEKYTTIPGEKVTSFCMIWQCKPNKKNPGNSKETCEKTGAAWTLGPNAKQSNEP